MRNYKKQTPATEAIKFAGFYCTDDVERYNHNKGFYFFDRDTMRSFGSRVLPQMYNKRVFVTSERNFDNTARYYTVRAINANGGIHTIGDFNNLTKYQAQKIARSIPAELITILDLCSLAYNTGKYYKQVKSYILKHFEQWERIQAEEIEPNFLISFINNDVLEA